MTETDLAITALSVAIDDMKAGEPIGVDHRISIKRRIDRASALYEHGADANRESLLPLLHEADALYSQLFHDERGRLKKPYS